MLSQAEHYAYRVEWHDPDEEFVGTCIEFPGLSWLADTQNGALDGIRSIVGETLDDMKAAGESIPDPLSRRNYSGKFQVRITPALHRKLVRDAFEQRVSLNALITDLLASS